MRHSVSCLLLNLTPIFSVNFDVKALKVSSRGRIICGNGFVKSRFLIGGDRHILLLLDVG